MTIPRSAAVLGVAGLVALACVPVDDRLMRMLGPYHGGLGAMLGGDVRREIEFVQQYGSFTCTVIVMLVVLLSDKKHARRIPVWIAAAVISSVCLHALKIFFGRPRPRVVYHEFPAAELTPWSFGFFWNQTALPRDVDPITPGFQPGRLDARSWEVTSGISSDLWSMPSSHSAAAFLMSAVLTRMYPRLTPLLVGLACLVAFARVLTGAHFVSDVIAGGALGWVVGRLVIDNAGR